MEKLTRIMLAFWCCYECSLVCCKTPVFPSRLGLARLPFHTALQQCFLAVPIATPSLLQLEDTITLSLVGRDVQWPGEEQLKSQTSTDTHSTSEAVV